MFERHEEIIVTKDNPFAEDRLDRAPAAELLIRLITATKQPFVLSIHGRWGSGKTTFVRMLRALLEKQEFQSLYFNAWESDFAEDPFVALIGSIQAEIDSGKIELSRAPHTALLWRKTKTLGGNFIRRAIPLGIKFASHGLLNLDDIQKSIESLGDVTSDVPTELENFAKERIGAYEIEKHAAGTFRTTLAAFAKELSDKNGGMAPLVVFIDELDRCRPTFAIQLLERLKHLFTVQGLFFVLSVDREQLAHSIAGVYGAGLDADKYLRRFINLEFQLPEPDRRAFAQMLFERLHTRAVIGTQPQRQEDEEMLLEMFIMASDLFEFGLRDMEQVATGLNIALAITAPTQKLFSYLVIFLIALRLGDRDAYESFKSGTIQSVQLIEKLKATRRGERFFSSRRSAVLVAYLHTITESDPAYHVALTSARSLGKTEGEEALSARTASILERLEDDGARGYLRRLIFERVELIKQFN